MNFRKEAESIKDELIAFRRDIHMYPEASMMEFRTTDKICEKLDEFAIPYRRIEPAGVIADIKGAKPGKTIAIRADIDALSIAEKTGLPFASVNEGLMHACGHDTHATMLMGAAKILNQHKDELCGNVRLFFQPGEEVCQGAKAIIAQGGMEGVDAAFMIHNGTMMPAGAVILTKGPSHAATDSFKIKVTGKTSHGAAPQVGKDAIVAASAIVMALQTMVSRWTTPTDPLVVTVGKFHAGSRFNIISGYAELEGTCRSYDVELHHSIPAKMEEIAKNTAAAYGCTAEVEYLMMCEPLINDDAMIALAKKAAAKVVDSPDMVLDGIAQMGGEDFSEYSVLVPGCFASLGQGGELPNHHECVIHDENTFPIGTALYCQVAYDYLNGEE
ncbi:MAG: amidohydrolase [Firmicutes bacterium]|nr:amidohydrolase [Bacillota bacterium]